MLFLCVSFVFVSVCLHLSFNIIKHQLIHYCLFKSKYSPCLIYFLGLTQYQAQGISLTLMLPPIGVLAFYTYYQGGHLSKTFILYAAIMACSFIVGGLLGSKLTLRTPIHLVKLIFGGVMLYASIKMIISGLKYFNSQ